MKYSFLLAYLIFCSWLTTSSQTTRVLFIGNSYTDVNNLPSLFQSIASANGDSVIVDKNTPGGYTFELHSTDVNTIAKIYSQQWDYVVLQEQSQRPSFSPAQVAAEVFPYAAVLDSMIHDNNPCSETVFYMTWGRKNGDASNCAAWPPVCTYEGMQARLRESYLELGMLNFATVGPVGAVWRYMRSLNPAFDLYQPDESHPSLHGSYLAACALYATIFHKEPVSTTFNPSLPQQDVTDIQNAVITVMNDSITTWYLHGSIPMASFSYTSIGNDVQFQNHSLNVSSYIWDFGDGNSSTNLNTSHTYQQPGTYTVTLTVTNGCKLDVIVQQVTTGTTSISEIANACSITLMETGNELQLNCRAPVKEVRIFDMSGAMLHGTILSDQTGKLIYKIPDLPKGIYAVKVSGDGFVWSEKVVR